MQNQEPLFSSAYICGVSYPFRHIGVAMLGMCKEAEGKALPWMLRWSALLWLPQC